MMANYGTPPIALVRGQGCHVWDVDGTEYLDLVAGIAVSSTRPRPPGDRRGGQRPGAASLAHTSNLAIHEPGLELAERLVALARRPGRVFFSQDGATANEAAYKIARRHGWTKDPERRSPGDHRRRGVLPRPHHGGAVDHREPAQAGAVRTAARSGDLRALRRRRGPGGGGHRPHGRGLPRTGARRGGDRRAARGLPRRCPRGLHPHTTRCWSSTRCSPGSGAPATGSPRPQQASGPDVITLAKGLAGGLAARGVPRDRCRRRTSSPRRPRHDVRRQPGLVRGGARGDRRRSRTTTC